MKWVCAFALVFLFSFEGLAQPYPSRPLRMVVPLSPGGFADVPARLLAPQELAAFMRAEYGKWGKVVHATGATVN